MTSIFFLKNRSWDIARCIFYLLYLFAVSDKGKYLADGKYGLHKWSSGWHYLVNVTRNICEWVLFSALTCVWIVRIKWFIFISTTPRLITTVCHTVWHRKLCNQPHLFKASRSFERADAYLDIAILVVRTFIIQYIPNESVGAVVQFQISTEWRLWVIWGVSLVLNEFQSEIERWNFSESFILQN